MTATYFQRSPAMNAPATRMAIYVSAVPRSGCIKTKPTGTTTKPDRISISRISNSSRFKSVRYRATNNIITSLTNSDTCSRNPRPEFESSRLEPNTVFPSSASARQGDHSRNV